MNTKGSISQLLAGIIIILAMAAFASTFFTVGKIKKGSFQMEAANQTAAKKLEELMNTSFDTLTNGTFTEPPGAANWNLKWTIEGVPAKSRLKKITVISKHQDKTTKAIQAAGNTTIGFKYADY